MSNYAEIGEPIVNELGDLGKGLQALVEAVKKLTDVQEGREQTEDPTVYTVETTDADEMERMLKATSALLALNDIANGSFYSQHMKHGDASGFESPAAALWAYRDHIFEVMGQHGISLDELL